MKVIAHYNLHLITGGIAGIYSIDRETGVISYSGCFGPAQLITPDDPFYQMYYDMFKKNVSLRQV